MDTNRATAIREYRERRASAFAGLLPEQYRAEFVTKVLADDLPETEHTCPICDAVLSSPDQRCRCTEHMG